MFDIPVLVLCAVLSAPAATPALPRTVHLLIEQDGGLPASALHDATEQTRLIWKAAGVTVTSGREADPVPAGAEIVPLRIEPETSKQINGRTVLAWVNLDEQRRPGPIFVSLPGLSKLLSRGDFHGRPVADQTRNVIRELTAQSVGRVIAHELGHYLLRSSLHSALGLMRPRYSAADLIGYSLAPFHIGPAQLAEIRQTTPATLTAARTTGR